MLILLLNIACFIGDPTDTGAPGTANPTTWTGMEYYLQGSYKLSKEFTCEMTWSTSGAVSTRYPCPECTFVFEIELVYDEENSIQDGSCNELAVDTTTIYSYTHVTNLDNNYPGYDVQYGVIGTYLDGAWMDLGYADWDQTTGTFYYGFVGPDSYYKGYYGEYTYGYAQLR